MPFQRAGVEFALRRGGRALIADEMGLVRCFLSLKPDLHSLTGAAAPAPPTRRARCAVPSAVMAGSPHQNTEKGSILVAGHIAARHVPAAGPAAGQTL